MNCYYLKFSLLSDASFGRGDGVAGLVDMEVQHDEYGLPYLGGRAIKGILVNECADILAALPGDNRKQKWIIAAGRLFGKPGSMLDDDAILSFGNAQLPEELRKAMEQQSLKPEEILETITSIRQQTAMEISGVPKEHSLRTQRVILRCTPFEARLIFSKDPKDDDLALIHACIMAFRRAGSSRNRGRGALKAQFCDENRKPIDKTLYYLKFKNEYIEEVAA